MDLKSCCDIPVEPIAARCSEQMPWFHYIDLYLHSYHVGSPHVFIGLKIGQHKACFLQTFLQLASMGPVCRFQALTEAIPCGVIKCGNGQHNKNEGVNGNIFQHGGFSIDKFDERRAQSSYADGPIGHKRPVWKTVQRS